MSMSAIHTIARREVKDTLTDWRILVPVFILTFVLPLVLMAAVNFAISFIGDPNTVVRMIPFTMLLVGFIPASFSLITALESFVGERERNSLEALLSMPISDNALYLGKLIAALLPPLLSSFLAMTVFALSLALRLPALFIQGLTVEYIVVVVLLIGIKAILMVAGAIIISSHTTSIRAANLLASFVLIPTAVAIQVEAILMIGRRWDVLQTLIVLFGVMAIVLVRTGMGAFNREEILSREHEQLNLRHVARTWRQFLREYQPAGVVPDQYSGAAFSRRRFYRHELPALLREYRMPCAIALIGAIVGTVAGEYIGLHYHIEIFDPVLAEIGNPPAPGVLLSLLIFANNLRVSVLSTLCSLFSFGTTSFLVPTVAFGQIGFVTGTLSSSGGSWFSLGENSPLQFLLGYVVPHGIIELPTAILSAGLGIRIGAALMSPPKGFTVGQNILWSTAQFIKIWALVLIPLFLLGSLIEGFLSPLVIRALYGG